MKIGSIPGTTIENTIVNHSHCRMILHLQVVYTQRFNPGCVVRPSGIMPRNTVGYFPIFP